MSATADPIALPVARAGRERLVTTLILALLAHGIVILGVGFVALAPWQGRESAVNIILVNAQKTKLPRRAAYLAPANQRGPGNTRRHSLARPAARSPNLFPNPGFAPAENFATAFPNPAVAHAIAAGTRERDIVTTRAASLPAASGGGAPSGQARPLLRVRLAAAAHQPDVTATPAIELPRLYGPRPRAATQRVNARAALAAPYLLAWRQRIERVGTAQFARLVPGGIAGGRLTLAVTLAGDGSVLGIALVKRSRHAALDTAALKIVRLAAPFPPFPPALAAQDATLTFTYRWHFIRGAAGTGSLGLGLGDK